MEGWINERMELWKDGEKAGKKWDGANLGPSFSTTNGKME